MFMTRSLSLLSAILVLSGCGALKVRDKNPAEVSKIKSVAVVALSVVQPEPKSLSLNIGTGKTEADSNGGKFNQASDHVELIYTDLSTALKKNLKWKVVDRTTMVTNAGYKDAFEKTMKGWQNKMPPSANYIQYNPNSVMDFDSPRILGPEGREALMKALKVDAIVVAQVNVHLTGTSVMGIGKQYPQSVLNLRVFARGQENPVWFDGNIEGEESKESVGMTGLFDRDLLDKLGRQSAGTAFAKIGTEKL